VDRELSVVGLRCHGHGGHYTSGRWAGFFQRPVTFGPIRTAAVRMCWAAGDSLSTHSPLICLYADTLPTAQSETTNRNSSPLVLNYHCLFNDKPRSRLPSSWQVDEDYPCRLLSSDSLRIASAFPILRYHS
jgi:hypothetical protein